VHETGLLKAGEVCLGGEGCLRAAVTGGAGFVGSHLVDRLLAEGFEVRVIDDLSGGCLENLSGAFGREGFSFVKGDIRNLNLVKKLLKGVDVVFHEAAFISVALSVKDPLLTNDVNVSGTLNLLKASVDANVKRFVYASSCAVYGEKSSPIVTEKDPADPISPYSVSKLAAETYVRTFYKVYGLKTTSLRCFNIYGPRQSFDVGNPYCGVVTIFLNRLQKNMPLTIYDDGKQTRDFAHVKDVVDAYLLAMNCDSAVGEVFNIGRGKSTSINELADTLGNIMHKKVKKEYADPRPGEIRHSRANIDKAKQILHFNPKVSLKKGLKELVDWHKNARAPPRKAKSTK